MYSLGGGIRLRHLRSLRAAFARQSFLTLAKKPSFNLWKFSGIPNFPKLPPLLLMSLLTRCYTRPGYMYRNRRTVDEEEEGEDDKAVGRVADPSFSSANLFYRGDVTAGDVAKQDICVLEEVCAFGSDR